MMTVSTYFCRNCQSCNLKYFFKGIKNKIKKHLTFLIKSVIWALDHDGALVGELYVFYELEDKDFADGKRTAYLCAFRVRKDFRGRGLGTKLNNSCSVALLIFMGFILQVLICCLDYSILWWLYQHTFVETVKAVTWNRLIISCTPCLLIPALSAISAKDRSLRT